MPEPKRTVKPPRIGARSGRRKPTQPPIIEPLPFHKEVYYSGLGLIDLASERFAGLPAKLRRLEKELVARGQKRNAVLTEQFEATRVDLTRRGSEFRSRAQRTVQDIWTALRGTNRGESASSNTTPGAV
jgi:hypothetical protein